MNIDDYISCVYCIGRYTEHISHKVRCEDFIRVPFHKFGTSSILSTPLQPAPQASQRRPMPYCHICAHQGLDDDVCIYVRMHIHVYFAAYTCRSSQCTLLKFIPIDNKCSSPDRLYIFFPNEERCVFCFRLCLMCDYD